MSPHLLTGTTVVILGACLAWGCGGSKLEAKTNASSLSGQEQQPLGMSAVALPAESISMPITQLERADVVATVNEGLGRFLQKFEIEASLNERGEFVGFRITQIADKETFQGLGIGAGDIITSINTQPIERPTEAYEAFISLKTAESLDIDYLRGGRLMRLSLPIVGEGPTNNGAKVEEPPKKP